eukprot:1146572-Pelagomonas_calceolata.AAC.1
MYWLGSCLSAMSYYTPNDEQGVGLQPKNLADRLLKSIDPKISCSVKARQERNEISVLKPGKSIYEYLAWIYSNSRGLENLSVETMHHLCRADQMWGGVISVSELWTFLLWAKRCLERKGLHSCTCLRGQLS